MKCRCALTAALAVLTLSGCAAFSGDGDRSGAEASGAPDGPLPVLASFYPLQFLVEEIGGERVEVASLTPPGVDPHTVELATRTVTEMGEAALVLYLSGFQPAVDEGVAVTGAHSLDAAEHVDLLTTDQTGHSHEHSHEDGAHSHDEHSDEEGRPSSDDHHQDDGHGAGSLDPHFWLDPERLAEVGHALAEELSAIDPAGADTYRDNSSRLGAELAELSEELDSGLARCENDTIVVAHEAYGYLTGPHGLQQEGLSGIDPEAEPSPARLAEVAAVVAEHEVSTVFVESLINPAVTEALAQDLGLDTAVLDPLENQQDSTADYLDVMRANLTELQDALGCAA